MIIRQICLIVRFHILHFGECLFTQVCVTKNRHKTTSKFYPIWETDLAADIYKAQSDCLLFTYF